jgi:hypothetical protein
MVPCKPLRWNIQWAHWTLLYEAMCCRLSEKKDQAADPRLLKAEALFMTRLILTTTAVLGILIMPALAHTFGAYECTDGCSGHKAGYEWAEAKGITDEQQCEDILAKGANRISFYEGCKTYVADPSRGADEDDGGGAISGK